MTGSPIDIAIEAAGTTGPVVVGLIGELDLSNAARVEAEIGPALGKHEGVVIDLTRLAFMDSSGLAVLNRIAGSTLGRGKRLRLVAGVDSAPRRVLEIVDLGIPIDDTLAKAREALT